MQCMLANLELCVHIMQFGSAQAGRHTKNATNRLSTFFTVDLLSTSAYVLQEYYFLPTWLYFGISLLFPGPKVNWFIPANDFQVDNLVFP